MKRLLRKVAPRSLWEFARRWRLKRHVDRFPRRIVTHSYAGKPRRVLIADGISEGWYDHDWDEPTEIGLLRRGRLRRGARVFDVGAHQGVVAMMLADLVGPEGAVLAVEGTKHNEEVARENARLNGVGNLTTLHAVVADEPGEIRYAEGLNGSIARDGGGQPTRAITIDDLAAEHGQPDVLFLDIEGAELKALDGATKTLNGGCDLFVEAHVGVGLEDFGGSAVELLDRFPESRYERLIVDLDSGSVVDHDWSGPPPRERFGLVALRR